MNWTQIRAEHRFAIAANDDVKLALIEDKTKRARFADVGRPTLEDIEAQFQLTKGKTGEIEQQRASRHPIETRAFREFLKTVQPSPLKSMVLRFVSSGKTKVA